MTVMVISSCGDEPWGLRFRHLAGVLLQSVTASRDAFAAAIDGLPQHLCGQRRSHALTYGKPVRSSWKYAVRHRAAQ
jgi:hypothetical protein